MGGGGGGGDGVPVSLSQRADAEQPASKRRTAGRRHQAQDQAQAAARLPLDIIFAEIAARSDPATLVRCAATCRDARRRVAGDPSSLLGRLRLRDTERFILPLLRGHMTGIRFRGYTGSFDDVLMLDTTTDRADATGLVKATFAEADETLRNFLLMDSRGGLVLVSATTTTVAQNNTDQRQLLVGNLAARRCQTLPPVPAFPDGVQSTSVQYVLLAGGSDVGEGAAGACADVVAVGRPFQVLKASLVLPHRLLLHTFSSEHGAWSPLTEIPIHNLHGTICKQSSRPLVVGGAVHWLCITDSGSYVLVFHVGEARVNVTSLPSSFPRDRKNNHYSYEGHHYLLATDTAGGNAVVLVADADRISAWEQSKHTETWKPHVVIENEAILGFKDDGLAKLIEKEERRWGKRKHVPDILWFGERSGAVFLHIHGSCLLWLDLHSKKIVRCFCWK